MKIKNFCMPGQGNTTHLTAITSLERQILRVLVRTALENVAGGD